MKTFINLLSLAIAICCSVFAATQTALAQTTNPFGGTTTVFIPTPIKATDARVAECRKLPELKNLTIDLDNIYEVHDDGTGRGCIILPIKFPIPTRTGSANETTYPYCWVYYDLRNFKNHEVIFCNAKVSRTEAGAQIVNAVINDAKGAMLVSMLYQNNDLRITQGTTPRENASDQNKFKHYCSFMGLRTKKQIMETNFSVEKPFVTAMLDSFENFEDTRKPCRTMYPLKEVLFLVFTSSLCGIRSFDEIAEFGEIKIDWLRQYLPYEQGIPSHDTLNRIMSWVKVEQLSAVLSELFGKQLVICQDKMVHIDGKKITGSATAAQQQTSVANGGKQAVAMVNMYSSSLQQCLASVGIDSKTNEQGAIEELLKYVKIKDCLVSLDAGFCNSTITGQIVEAGAAYFIRVKQNQPKLLATMIEMFAAEPIADHQEGVEEKSHGRVEKRDCSIINLNSISSERQAKYETVFGKWINLHSLVKVKRYRKEGLTKKISEEEAYFIVSLPLTAKKANEVARSHWSIENKLHWQLDVILGEDADRKRTDNSAHNMSILYKIVLNIHQTNKTKNKSSLKREMTKCAVSDAHRTKILESL